MHSRRALITVAIAVICFATTPGVAQENTIVLASTTSTGDSGLFEYLLPIATRLRPESQGGALLLGVEGICVISHGSSNATAIMNALRVADEMESDDVVAKLKATIRPDHVA